MNAPRPLAGTRVAVLGASGFVGRWVARALTERGAEVHAGARDVDRTTSVLRAYGAKARIAAVDVARETSLGAWVRDVHPAVLFNLVGYGVDSRERDEGLAYRVNRDLAAHLVEILAESENTEWPGARLVHIGSAQEYGEAAGDLEEGGEALPTTLYGRSKLAGTKVMVERAVVLDVRSVVARLFTVYGPGEHANRLLPSLIAAASRGASIPLTAGLQLRDFGYVGDVAEGLLRLAEATIKPGTIVNLASGRLHTVQDFTRAVARRLSIPETSLRFGEVPTRGDEMQHGPVNVARLRALTGWSLPGDLEGALDRAISEHRRLGADGVQAS